MTTSSELLPEADAVVHNYVPNILEAAGLEASANLLRNTGSITECENLVEICETLSSVQKPDEHIWTVAIEDVVFWAEAAVWAAVREDCDGYQEASHQIQIAIQNMATTYVH